MKLEHADMLARATVDKLRATMGEFLNEGEVIKILFPKYAHGGAGSHAPWYEDGCKRYRNANWRKRIARKAQRMARRRSRQ